MSTTLHYAVLLILCVDATLKAMPGVTESKMEVHMTEKN